MLDRKGISAYLILTFGITYAVEVPLVLAGVRFDGTTNLAARYYIWGVMWVPALAAFVTARWITREGMAGTGLRFGPWRAYVIPMFVIPLGFALIFGLTWLLGLGAPDWKLDYFFNLMRQSGADLSTAPAPGLVLVALLLTSLAPAALLNGLFGFGEELGWRGYLLPKLMPLGKPTAYLTIGVIWGLWHLPLLLAGFNYGSAPPVLAVIAFIALTTCLGIYLNEAALRCRSAILAGWLHGIFNSQRLGMWALLFPAVQPLLGGPVGLIGIAVWLALGLIALRRPAWLGLPDAAPVTESRFPAPAAAR